MDFARRPDWLPFAVMPMGQPRFVDTAWRSLDLPHDWSIEGPFGEKEPARPHWCTMGYVMPGREQ